MNICMTHYAFYPTTGGVESHLLDLCAELVRQGHEVHALVGSLEGSPTYEEIEGIRVHRTDWMNPETVRAWKTAEGLAPETVWPELHRRFRNEYRRFLSEHGCDVVHAHNFHHFLPEYGLALTDLYEEGVPTLLTIHEVWSEFICDDLLRRTQWDAIITVSRHVMDGIHEQAPHLRNVHLVYHGIDTELFSPENRDDKWINLLGLEDRRFIIHPARMLPWKGVVYSILALDLLRERYPSLALIVTDTDNIVDWIGELRGYKEEVLRLVEERGLEGQVITQPFPYVELPWVYNYADAVLYPTIGEEPFGLVPVEAMACARPTIVTRSGGLVESVVDWETGCIIEKENAEELADRLDLLLSSPALAQQFGQAGRRRATELFTRERMAREVVELYRHSLHRAQQRGLVPAAAG